MQLSFGEYHILIMNIVETNHTKHNQLVGDLLDNTLFILMPEAYMFPICILSQGHIWARYFMIATDLIKAEPQLI